ncbi:hypothetical protein DV735_g3603, partial [Chaetothyriales sp. CBS 134920]
MRLLLPSFRAQQLLLDFASLENSCPDGIYLSPSPSDPSRWTGVFFVRSGPYEPAILRFHISFPPAYPSQPPLITFSSDVFHPLCVPSTVYTFSTGPLDAVGTVSASDEDRLPPGSFSLRHAFPGWFGRQDSRGSSPDADAAEGQGERGLADSRGTTLKVLQHLKQAFEDPHLLDLLRLETVGNASAWHAWRAHRGLAQTLDDDRQRFEERPSQTRPASPRHPGQWNWEGVWESRVRDGLEACTSDAALFNVAGPLKFSRLDDEEFSSAKRTMERAAELEMEYFDFEDASHLMPSLELDDPSMVDTPVHQENANHVNRSFDSFFPDRLQEQQAPEPGLPAPVPGSIKLKLMNDIAVEVIPQPDDANLEYPMFRAKEPCDLCARMGLDCFFAKRGVMISGCTCCISLYKDCSYTHPNIPKGYVSTFPGISEDHAWTDVSRDQKKSLTLKSFDEARGRKAGARFPREAVKILKQWLAEHADHPYPNKREKDELKQVTGLKRSQISNWLANARRRGKVRAPSCSSSPVLDAIDIPGAETSMADLDPLDRWKISPPENEPASMTAIARAVVTATTPMAAAAARPSSPSSRGYSRSRASSCKRGGGSSETSSGGFSRFRAPSVSSFETRDSTNSVDTLNSSRSAQSKRSHVSAHDRRRRRRAPMTQRAALQQAKSRSVRIFQCTFCTDTFPAKYDWQRHEKSLHLALERWVCCPEGGVVTSPLTGVKQCAFCQRPNPSAEHLEEHNFGACHEKTLQERTFYRKDHLRQHLKLMHGCKYESHMEEWKSTTNEIKSSCGFCPSQFATWSQRADHLAAHFRNGADMSMWVNGWGFEPHIERRVENSIPPYLIGHERRTMEPYVARFLHEGQSLSASTAPRARNRNPTNVSNTPSSGSNPGLTCGGISVGDSEADGEPDQMTKDSNCWARLEDELSKFVAQHKIAGTIPTNQQIQDAARMIIFEDDDPWNWTCADNQQWLDTFKYQQGIGGVTQSMGITSRNSGGSSGSLGPQPPTEPGSSTTTTWTKTLAEVPVLAPYVIPGGNKQGSGAAKGKAMNMFNPNLGSTDLDHDMQLDFEGIDFSTLDLGMMSDGEFGLGGGTPGLVTNAESFSPVPAQVQDFTGEFIGMEHDMGVGSLDFGLANYSSSFAGSRRRP